MREASLSENAIANYSLDARTVDGYRAVSPLLS